MTHAAHGQAPAKKGVVLFNLGGPEKLADVRPFLYNLFSDPDIIRIRNGILRKGLAWLIAAIRQRKSRNLYRQIGGGSPLRRITDGQAEALRRKLGTLGCTANVYVGMRCWKPSIDDAVARMLADGITRLAALPLFPQFSLTTTGSCFKRMRLLAERSGLASAAQISYVDAWFDDPLYVESLAELIRDAQGKFSAVDPAAIHHLYSAHSIPESYIADGDPYRDQTETTVSLINQKLGIGSNWTLAYQSKVGPVKWLGPPTDEALVDLGRRGVNRVLVIPVSFVSDHIETLQELDIAYREVARTAGIAEYVRAAAPNLNPRFIEALAHIAARALNGSGP